MKEVKNYGLVSIIMPAYNSSKYIGQAIESVISQTYKNWELIIVDDDSKDNTLEVIKKYMREDNRIKCISLKKNYGAAHARNIAIENSKGKYLAFLDSDDLWYPEKLEKQISFMEKNNYYFSCTAYQQITDDNKVLKKIIKVKNKYDYNEVLKNCPGNSTVIYNSHILGKIKAPNIKRRNDFIMWLRVIKKAEYLYGLNQPLSIYRIRKGSLSKNKIKLIKYQWKVYREFEKLSYMKSTYLVFYKIIQSLIK